MPSPLISGDILQVVYRTRVFEQQCLNVLHYKMRSPVGTPSYTEDLDVMFGLLDPLTAMTVGGALRKVLAENTTIEDCTLQRVYPTRDYYIRFPVGLAGVYDGGPCTASNVSAVITKQSERPGRGRAGSIHIPGVPSTAYDDGRLSNAYRAELLLLQDALKAPLIIMPEETEIADPGMFNSGQGAPNNFSLIVNTTIQSTLRIVRRRTVGVGI